MKLLSQKKLIKLLNVCNKECIGLVELYYGLNWPHYAVVKSEKAKIFKLELKVNILLSNFYKGFKMILGAEKKCLSMFKRHSIARMTGILDKINELRFYLLQQMDKSFFTPKDYKVKREDHYDNFELKSMLCNEPKKIIQEDKSKKQAPEENFFPTQIKHEKKKAKNNNADIAEVNENMDSLEVSDKNSISENELEIQVNDVAEKTEDIHFENELIKSQNFMSLNKNLKRTSSETDKSLLSVQIAKIKLMQHEIEQETYLKKLKTIFDNSAFSRNLNKGLESLKEQINVIYEKSPINLHEVLMVKSSQDKNILPKIKDQCRSKSSSNLDLVFNNSREKFNDFLDLKGEEKVNFIGFKEMQPGKVFSVKDKNKSKVKLVKLPSLDVNYKENIAKLGPKLILNKEEYMLVTFDSKNTKSTNFEEMINEFNKSMFKFKKIISKQERKNLLKRRKSS